MLDYRSKDAQDEKSKKTSTNESTKFQQQQQRKDIFKDINGKNPILSEQEVIEVFKTNTLTQVFEKNSCESPTRFSAKKCVNYANNWQTANDVSRNWKNKSKKLLLWLHKVEFTLLKISTAPPYCVIVRFIAFADSKIDEIPQKSHI